MGKMLVTRRELQRAYRNHYKAYQAYNNDHRIGDRQTYMLLLFYAAECGLKALWLKRNSLDDSHSGGELFSRFNHNLNYILDHLRAHISLRLPRKINISQPGNKPERVISPDQLNQAWRYGCRTENELELETKLKQIIEWIGREVS